MLSGKHVLEILERRPKIVGSGREVYTVKDEPSKGIRFENVSFAFPARPNIPILRNLNLFIATGTTLALVGPSGSGKSTTVQMLMRYYDPDSGSVSVNGKRTVDYERLETLRHNFGLVSQEPVLFDRTVAENIAYGDNTREVPMAEVIAAARNANIHEFVMNLPEVRRGWYFKGGFLITISFHLGLQHCAGYSRREFIGGTEAADCDRPCLGEGSEGADFGRGNFGVGQSE